MTAILMLGLFALVFGLVYYGLGRAERKVVARRKTVRRSSGRRARR